jgi:hypothetical protein
MSLTFLPSSALASRVAQMGSTSTLAAEVRALIFSACGCDQADVMLAIFKAHSDLLLVIGQDEGGVYSC